MKTTLSWLREFVDLPEDARTVADALTFSGTEVEHIEQLPDGDALFTLEVTPNRPDCLSIRGLARELSAVLDRDLRTPDATLDETDHRADRSVAVTIRDPKACPRYVARVMRGATNGPSPEWMIKRLESVGLRSINAVVDVTNYVMLELGHPLHAFDLSRIETREVVVRAAKKRESFVSLDEVEHVLSGGETLICDGERPVAIGGVIGGLDSGVTGDTVNILLESAYFEPGSIRRTSRDLGVSTESSYRFERGADPVGAEFVSRRAVSLICELTGAKLEEGSVDAFPAPIKPRIIAYTPSRADKMIGVSIDPDCQRRILTRLGFEVGDQGDAWLVTVPTFRPDVSRDVDLIEEVARVWGYDNLPADRSVRGPAPQHASRSERVLRRAREALTAQGFAECVSSVYVSEQEAGRFSGEKSLAVSRPLSEELAVLRPSLLHSILSAAAFNVNRGASALRLFEYGHGYHHPDDDHPSPWESHRLALLITGDRFETHWGWPDGGLDAHDLLGALDVLADRLGVSFDYVHDESIDQADGAFAITVHVGDEPVGRAFLLSRDLTEEYDVESPVFAAELDCDLLERAAVFTREAAEPSRYPEAKRDLALVVDDSVAAGELVRVVREAAGPKCASVVPFDLYRGKQIPTGRYSLAMALRFVDKARTLEDSEVDEAVKSAVDAAVSKLDAEVRSW